MCGIVGIIHPENKGTVDGGILRAMNSALRHRGPDDEGYWIHHNVGLGMRRLSIIDVAGGHQPVANEDGNVWAVFNGEIYNFLELRRELIQKGHRFKSRSDSEVIVHLYEEKGEDFVQDLRGMFAIALWDARARKLLLYRDRVGIKPLHYRFKNGTLLFASEIKALLEYPEVSREISLPAVNDYLSFLYIPTPKTIYREIAKLPAGHFLRYAEGEIKIRRYWDFEYQENSERSESVCAERLREAIRESVKLHLISDVPLGAFLSGGMDSSTVVASMSEENASPVKTFSIGFQDDEFNELPYAREVAGYFKTDHREQIMEVNALHLLPKILSGFDEPFADSSAIPTFLVSEFARKQVTVALSGDGGDELFAGYTWTRKENWLEQYRKLPHALRRAAESFFLKKGYHPVRETNALSLIQRFIYDAKQSPFESFARRSMCFQPWMKEELFRPWFREALKEDRSAEILRGFFDGKNSASLMNRLLYLDSKVYLPDDLLTKVDRMSMMHSLELRVPLLDHKLIELAGSIPFSLKLKGRTTKSILKQAMKNTLPPKILRQRKQGFSIPLKKWFQGDLHDFSKKLLLDQKSECSRYFRTESIRRLLDEHRSGRQNFGHQLYTLVVFELWSRLAQQKSGSVSSEALLLKDLV